MIKQLQIENFQSHNKSILNFKPGVNVIIGPSDSGKSSIIRALRWVAWNRPLGDNFQSLWGGATKIKVVLNNDLIIKRQQGKKNFYQLIEKEEKTKFKAFGKGVPEEIEEALNISDINLQQQMDSPFLLSNNPGEVSRHFNKIANIDKIDSSLKSVESWLRAVNQNIDNSKSNIEGYKENIKTFDYLDKMEQEIEVLEDLEGRKNNTYNSFKRLKSISVELIEIDDLISDKSKITKAEEPVEKVLELIQNKKEKINDKKELKKCIAKIGQLEKTLSSNRTKAKADKIVQKAIKLYATFNQLKEETENFKKIYQNAQNTEIKLKEAVSYESDKGLLLINTCLNLYNKIGKTKNKIIALNSHAKNLIICKKEHQKKSKKLDQLEDLWHKEIPDQCPLCEGTGYLK